MMKHAALLALIPALGSAALVEKAVTYEHDGTTLEGFHVYDDAASGKRPAILVIHQWTGLGNYEKDRSRMLAGLGYNVFAADIYGKGVRPRPPESGREASKYKSDRRLFRGRLAAGLAVLAGDERTAPSKIAAIGYCFGGTGVLELARSGADIAGVVSFHGGLGSGDGSAADKGAVKARVLVCHGARDPHVPESEVLAFWNEMNAAAADWQLITYPDSVHAFTQKMAGDDPSKGAAYNAAADQRSWADMLAFFKQIFK